jgi:hypothetical protein
MKNLFLLFGIIFLIGCKKNQEQLIRHSFDSKVKLIVDSLLYKDEGANMYYKLIIPDSLSIYKVMWISPSENIGTGPFYTLLLGSYVFSVAISDSVNNIDTIKYYYDYRDKLVGNYKCKVRDVYITDAGGNNFVDTLSVLKSDNNKLSILDCTLILNSNWNGTQVNHDNLYKFYVNFFPEMIVFLLIIIMDVVICMHIQYMKEEKLIDITS